MSLVMTLLNVRTTARRSAPTVTTFVMFAAFSVPSIQVYAAPSSSTPTLRGLLKEAQKNFETIVQSDARIGAAEAGARQAWAMVMPQVNLGASYTRLDRPPGPVSQFNLPGRPEARLVLRQPIFQRGQEYYRLAQADLNIEAAQQLKRVQTTQLLIQTVEAFFRAKTAVLDVESLRRQVELSQKRVLELKNRERIGRTRTSELLAATSALAGLEVQQLTAQRASQIEIENIFYLTQLRLEPRQIVEADEVLPSVAANAEAWVQALPQVKEAQTRYEITANQRKQTLLGHLPTIDFTANYFLKRVGILENQKWDFTIAFDLPLFQGGGVVAATREAVEQEKIAELELQRLRREWLNTYNKLYAQVTQQQTEVALYERAVKLNQATVKAQESDFRQGLVTNLDVLQSLQSLTESERAYHRALSELASVKATMAVLHLNEVL